MKKKRKFYLCNRLKCYGVDCRKIHPDGMCNHTEDGRCARNNPDNVTRWRAFGGDLWEQEEPENADSETD